MRILILIAIGLLLYVIIGNLLRRNKPSSPELLTEKMVQCQHCNLHILEQEAIQSDGDYYCSTEHVELHHSSK